MSGPRYSDRREAGQARRHQGQGEIRMVRVASACGSGVVVCGADRFGLR